MGVIVAMTIALMLWVIAWGLGINAFDGFMAVLAVLLVAFTARLLAPFVRQQLGK
jgi:hypothetical protein